MKPTVSFLTYDWSFGTQPLEPNGCAWYRCVLPSRELEKNGWSSSVGFPGWNDKHGFGLLLSRDEAVHGWDIIVLKLIMLKDVAEKIKDAKNLGQKIVVDIDDWFEGLEKTNLAYKTTDPKNNEKNNRDHYMYIINNADAIITSTPFLYDFYKNTKGMKNVYMVRNGIDIGRWHQRKDHSRYLPRFGWVGATPWRSSDLEQLDPFFGKFLEKNRLDFHHSGHVKGSPLAEKQLNIPKNVKVTTEPMKPISRYPELFRKIDVGIVPLNDVGFNHAKSYIKGLEYAASGVPFISSWSPEYELLESQGVGRVARNEEEWIHHLEELVDPRKRKEDAEKNLEGIIEHNAMSSTGLDWNDVMHAIKEQ